MAEISDDVKLLAGDVKDVPVEDKIDDVQDDIVLLEDGANDDIIVEDEPLSDDEPVVEAEPADKAKDILPHERPTLTDIKKEFPDFFKKFPSMEHMLFREKEYSTIFPTVAEAKDASESQQALDDFRNDLFVGNGEKFTTALKDAGELDKFSRNFLTNLQKTDKDGYWNAITPTLENLVKGFMREGQRRNDQNLIASAENLSIYLFDTDEVAKGTKTMIKAPEKEDKRVEEKLANIDRQQYNNFRINVLDGIATGLDPLIGLGKMANIKPSMQKILSKQIQDEIDGIISKDSTHMSYVNGLWNKAKGSYTNEIKSKIISAYLERAKSLVPSIRRRVLADVLGMSVDKVREAKEQNQRTQLRREPGSSGRPAGPSTRVHSAKSIDWNKTSDMDLLNGNVTTKK
jgi:hypothetical protein